MSPNRKLALLLMRKAAQDETVLRILSDSTESPYEAIGFHAPQAVEKIIKAVLVAHEVKYRRVHDIVELIRLLQDNAIPFPVHLEELRRLTPFAIDFRYDEFLPDAAVTLERDTICNLVEQTRAWAEKIIV